MKNALPFFIVIMNIVAMEKSVDQGVIAKSKVAQEAHNLITEGMLEIQKTVDLTEMYLQQKTFDFLLRASPPDIPRLKSALFYDINGVSPQSYAEKYNCHLCKISLTPGSKDLASTYCPYCGYDRNTKFQLPNEAKKEVLALRDETKGSLQKKLQKFYEVINQKFLSPAIITAIAEKKIDYEEYKKGLSESLKLPFNTLILKALKERLETHSFPYKF